MDWTWSSSEGFWQPDIGLSAACEPIVVSTLKQERRHAYDFWSSAVFYDFMADRPDISQRRDFRASASGLISGQGSFFQSASDAVSGSRSAAQARSDGIDVMTFGFVFSGRRSTETADGATAIAEPGSFFAYDAARPSKVDWTAHRSASLVLPRQSVINAIGGDIPAEAELAQRLANDPLAPFLRGYLHQLVQHGTALDTDGHRVTLAGLTGLALAALRSAYRIEAQDEAAQRRALLTAAKTFIDRHLTRPDLDAAMLATALGISRASLYRLFSGQEQSVSAAIRAARLARARQLLSSMPQRSIAEIASQCGLDTPHFSRMFREQFGITPSQAREMAKETE